MSTKLAKGVFRIRARVSIESLQKSSIRNMRDQKKEFDKVPVEDTTHVLAKGMDQLGGYSVRLESWFDTEYNSGGKTLVFKAEEVEHLPDNELFALCRTHRACTNDEPDEDFTIIRDSKGFTFVNFGMERK